MRLIILTFLVLVSTLKADFHVYNSSAANVVLYVDGVSVGTILVAGSYDYTADVNSHVIKLLNVANNRVCGLSVSDGDYINLDSAFGVVVTGTLRTPTILAALFSSVGFNQGFGLGIVTAGVWMLAGFMKSIYKEVDE